MIQQPYPVSYDIAKPEHYNRWTVAFRLILAIPQLILVGAGSYQFSIFEFGNHDASGRAGDWLFNGGILTAVLGILVFFAWFAILFTGRFPSGMRGFCATIFRWSQNVRAYLLLQAAPYPPFGVRPYPLDLRIVPAEQYSRWAVFFRFILVIPHGVILFFLGIAQAIVTLIAWFAILITGQFPSDLFAFSVGVSRWFARVEAYLYLFVDTYPPFSMAAESGPHLTPSPAI